MIYFYPILVLYHWYQIFCFDKKFQHFYGGVYHTHGGGLGNLFFLPVHVKIMEIDLLYAVVASDDQVVSCIQRL